MDKITFWLIAIFSIVVTVAMINLWDWNVENSGGLFAFGMAAIGPVVFIMNLAHRLGWFDKFFNGWK